MAYQEVIDNIQDRLERLVIERFSGGQYNNIKMEVSDYNPNIDDTVTVNIKITTQDNVPVKNYTVPLKVDGVSVSGVVTDNNGEAVYNHKCSKWGLCRFSIESYTCFINILDKWKQVSVSVGYLFILESQRLAHLLGSQTVTTSQNVDKTIMTLPTQYQPQGILRAIGHNTTLNSLIRIENGTLIYKTQTSSQTHTCSWNFLYRY